MRFGWVVMTVSLAGFSFSGCSKSERQGLSFTGETVAEQVQLLVDETWIDAEGQRHVKQEIFDSVYEMIDQAEQFILIDFFLVNEFLYTPDPLMRNLSKELTDKLVAKCRLNPAVKIIFISDPVNTVYGSIESPLFKAMEDAGVQVVWTDLDQLRDSNPIISKPWRLLAKRWGVGPGKAVKNPLGDGRISIRSFLKFLNIKANHRKVVITEKSLLVTSANPHSGSSAHWNVGLRVDGAGIAMACESELAILNMSGAGGVASALSEIVEEGDPRGGIKLEILTERKIKDRALTLLTEAGKGSRIDLSMFYFSDRDLIRAFIDAKERGCVIRVILDPTKDAFGRTKNGVPNRQTAARFTTADIPVRWADTHGEQCHVKMLYVEHTDQTATLLLGSGNYTRRNMDDFNAECDLAITAPLTDETMKRALRVFERWWTNSEGRIYTTAYETYEDDVIHRKLQAWLMETTGFCTF